MCYCEGTSFVITTLELVKNDSWGVDLGLLEKFKAQNFERGLFSPATSFDELKGHVVVVVVDGNEKYFCCCCGIGMS